MKASGGMAATAETAVVTLAGLEADTAPRFLPKFRRFNFSLNLEVSWGNLKFNMTWWSICSLNNGCFRDYTYLASFLGRPIVQGLCQLFGECKILESWSCSIMLNTLSSMTTVQWKITLNEQKVIHGDTWRLSKGPLYHLYDWGRKSIHLFRIFPCKKKPRSLQLLPSLPLQLSLPGP